MSCKHNIPFIHIGNHEIARKERKQRVSTKRKYSTQHRNDLLSVTTPRVALTEPEFPEQVVITHVAAKGTLPEKSLMVQSHITIILLHHHIARLHRGGRRRKIMINYYQLLLDLQSLQ